jgi:ubiquinone/menaquinone biosynthesis C-methylase UbiE
MNAESIHWTGARARHADRHFHSKFRRQFDREVFRHILPIIKKDGTVLDLGAGTGFMSIGLAAHLGDGNVVAVDESEDMLRQLSRRARKMGFSDRIETRVADASSTGLPAESVDLVVSANLLHEVANPQSVIKEIARVLKPGGIFVIQDFRDGLFWKIFRRYHSDIARGPLSVDELYVTLEENGLDELVIQTRRLRYIASGRKPNGTYAALQHGMEQNRAR